MKHAASTLQATGLTLLLASLAACSSMAPDYQRPAAPVPATFTDAPATATNTADTATPVQDIPWKRFFTDTALQQLIQTALDNNRDLRVALLNVEKYRAQADIQDADRWPSMALGAGVTREITVGVPLTTVYSAGVLVTSYEADLFGRLRSLSDAALAQYLATSEASQATRISLIGAVATAYYGLHADNQLLRLAQDTVQTRENSLRLTQLRFTQGASTQLDLSQAEALLQAARVSLAQTSRQTTQDRNALALLLGHALTPEQSAQLAKTSSTLPMHIPDGLRSELLLRRPDVLQAEQLLIAANANIGAARANFFPQISLTGSVGSASTELSSLFQDGTYAWTIAPQLLLPIFDAGRNRAQLKVAEVSRDIAVAQYEKAIQSAFREVADALAACSTLTGQFQAQQAQTEAARNIARLTDLRLQHGASSALEVLDAQRTLYAAQQAEIQLQSQVQQSLATLYRVLGGGYTTSAALRKASTAAGTPQ